MTTIEIEEVMRPILKGLQDNPFIEIAGTFDERLPNPRIYIGMEDERRICYLTVYASNTGDKGIADKATGEISDESFIFNNADELLVNIQSILVFFS